MVHLKGEVVGMGTPDDGPKLSSVPSRQTGITVVSLCYSSEHLLVLCLPKSMKEYTFDHWRTQGGGLGGSNPPKILKF
jgi:hypothetical protein